MNDFPTFDLVETILFKYRFFENKNFILVKWNYLSLIHELSWYNYKLNLSAAIAVISNFIKIDKLNKNIFKDYIQPPGRGDLKKIKIKKKTIQLIDESYNSNPLSLKFSIEKFDKIEKNPTCRPDKVNDKSTILLLDIIDKYLNISEITLSLNKNTLFSSSVI